MKKISIFMIITLGMFTGIVHAQSLSRTVISSIGSNNNQLSYTVGETVIHTGSSSTIILTQGFLQPDRLFPDFIDPLGQETTFRLFPNPSKAYLTLELNTEQSFRLDVSFVDAKGSKVLTEESLMVQQNTRTEFDVSSLASGHYVMILSLVGSNAKRSIRFQKVD